MDIEDCVVDGNNKIDNVATNFGSIESTTKATSSNWEPPYWRQHLDNIRQMRSSKDAPVDSMGAFSCADIDASPETKRYQILLALMLSSQTKDSVTYAAMMNLRKYGCTVDKIVELSEEKLAELIYPVGFYKRKASYIKKTTTILREKFRDDIPTNLDDLCSLPGVGPKMAHLTMDLAWMKPSGIGVDTHVHRICNRLGWNRTTTKNPEETRQQLEKWLPNDLWSELNLLMVGFGQQICLPVKPKCGQCLNRNICLYSRQNGEQTDGEDEDVQK